MRRFPQTNANPLSAAELSADNVVKRRDLSAIDDLLAGYSFVKDNFQTEVQAAAKCYVKFRRWFTKAFVNHYINVSWETDVLPTYKGLVGEIFDWLQHMSLPDMNVNSLHSLNQAIKALQKVSDSDTFAAFFSPDLEHMLRLTIYKASAGDEICQREVAQRCIMLAVSDNENRKGDSHLYFRSAIGWLNPGVLDTSIETAQRDFLSPVYALLAGDVTLTQLRDKIEPHQFRLIFGLTNTGNGVPLTATGGDADATDLQKVQSVNGPSIIVFPTIGDPDENLRAREAKKMIEPVLAKSIPLVAPPNLKVVRHNLVAAFPHAGDIIDAVLKDVSSRRTAEGHPYIGFRPVLLVGEPGSGKSTFAQQVGEMLGLKPLLYGCAASTPDGMFGSTARAWGTGMMSTPASHILRNGIANPLVVLDEIEKAGSSKNNGSLLDVILPMLESSTASQIYCSHLKAPTNLSKICWIATANSLSSLSAPLRDRFRIMHFPVPSNLHLAKLADSLLYTIARDRGLDLRWASALTAVEIEMVRQHWRGGSIRALRRLVEVVFDARDYNLSVVSN